MSDFRHFTSAELSGMFSRLRELIIGGCDEEIKGSQRDCLVEYLVEILRRTSSRRFATLLLSRDIDRILAELAEEVDP